MSDMYECKVCHTLKEGRTELCEPEPTLEICSPQVDKLACRDAQCEPMEQKTGYYCAGCGRPSPMPDQLCIPQRY